MPFESRAQQRFFFANPGKLGGLKKVMHWAHETNFGTLPERKGKLQAPTRRKGTYRPPRAGERQQ